MAHLLVDIGNTDTCAAIAEGGKLVDHVRATTQTPALEFLSGAPDFRCDEVMIASVVPAKNDEWESAVEKVFGFEPKFCSAKNACKFLSFGVDEPETVGADRVADCVAALEFYGAPVIVVDFGTATNIEFVNSKREFCGGILMPGVFSGMRGLSAGAAKLQNVRLEAPESLIGKTTEKSIQSGLIYGEAARVDGLIERIKDEYRDEDEDIKTVATGGFLNLVAPHCKNIDFTDSTLTLKGLEIILNSIL